MCIRDRGQSGQNTFIGSVMTPSRVILDNGTPLYAKFIYASKDSTYAIDVEGKLYSWGSNEFGKLGTTDIAVDDKTFVPRRIEDASDWTDVASYENHVVGIRGEGKSRKFYAWGRNDKKQISLSDDAHFATPQEIFLPANPDF